MSDSQIEYAETAQVLPNNVYTALKNLSLYLLPALAAAYFGIAQIWGLPKAEEVVGTVVVLEALLGAVLRISKVRYDASDAKFDGAITITPDENREFSDLKVSIDPAALHGKDELTVKVNKL